MNKDHHYCRPNWLNPPDCTHNLRLSISKLHSSEKNKCAIFHTFARWKSIETKLTLFTLLACMSFRTSTLSWCITCHISVGAIRVTSTICKSIFPKVRFPSKMSYIPTHSSSKLSPERWNPSVHSSHLSPWYPVLQKQVPCEVQVLPSSKDPWQLHPHSKR